MPAALVTGTFNPPHIPKTPKPHQNDLLNKIKIIIIINHKLLIIKLLYFCYLKWTFLYKIKTYKEDHQDKNIMSNICKMVI